MRLSFDEAVERETQRLSRRPFAETERETQAKRLAWLRQRSRPGAVSPRRAFEALFLDYLGLDPAQLVVRREGPDEIFWESRNPCPTLAACESLGLDTRIVCRRVSDKPVQGFLSYLDPRLRFVRDYDHLRPHEPFCAEGIVRIDLEALMAVAIEEARQSRAEGNKGYGAVVVRGKRLLAQAHDTAVTDNDPLAHAEVNAIRQAVRASGHERPLRSAAAVDLRALPDVLVAGRLGQPHRPSPTALRSRRPRAWARHGSWSASPRSPPPRRRCWRSSPASSRSAAWISTARTAAGRPSPPAPVRPR